MTGLSFLWEVGSPWTYIGFGEQERLGWIPSYFYAKKGTKTCVRKLRGWKMRTVQGLMDEFAAALQFFDGFGENWGALEDCLMWMDEWLPAEAYVLVVEKSEELLADEPGDLGDFLATIQTVGESWSQPVEFPSQFRRDARPFHLLLNVSRGNSEAVARLIEVAERSGVDYRQV